MFQTYPSLNEPDEDTREAFKERVAEVFSDPSSILVFQDEVHFSIQSTITREWAQKGSERDHRNCRTLFGGGLGDEQPFATKDAVNPIRG